MDYNLLELIKSNFFDNEIKTNRQQIIEILNKKCTKDISASLTNLLNEIDETLNSSYVKEVDKKYSQLCIQSNLLLDEIDTNIDSVENLNNSVDKSFQSYTEVVRSIKDKCDEIHALEAKYETLEKKEKVLEIISAIQSALILEDIELASEQMAEFISLIPSFNSCLSVKKSFHEQIRKYHETIEDQLTKLFQECMLEIQWPFISNGLIRTSSQLNTEKFDLVALKFSEYFRSLYLIELPDDMQAEATSNVDFINTRFMPFEPICLPMRLLLKPLVQYFRYFFWTESKVNKIGRPEWYMTQVIQWISIHQAALEQMFSKSLLDCIDVKLEFIRSLVVMVMEKVHKDLKLTKQNDDLFFHLIEECLTMTLDLRREFDYPSQYPDPVDVICHDIDSFDHWMNLEQRFALKQLDDVFMSAGSWKPLSTKCKRPECLESFLGLIMSMKERIECVYEVSNQARFCQVLLEVLENFRLRLLQISKNYDANTRRWYDIMNVVLAVRTFLQGWRLDQMFIDVHDFNERHRKGSGSSKINEDKRSASSSTASSSIYTHHLRHLESRHLESDSLFSGTLSLYQHALVGLSSACIDTEFEGLAARADSYLRQSWLLPEPQEAFSQPSLSASASGMMLLLRDRLHELHAALETVLFEEVWQGLADRVDQLLFRELLLGHRFTPAGAAQVDRDLRRNLLPLFAPYSRNPQRFFGDCLEACTLLTVAKGTAVLTRDILRASLAGGGGAESPLAALREIGVTSLSPDRAEAVLARRVDVAAL